MDNYNELNHKINDLSDRIEDLEDFIKMTYKETIDDSDDIPKGFKDIKDWGIDIEDDEAEFIDEYEYTRQHDGEDYYYVDTSLNMVEHEKEWHCDEDDIRFYSGNYFETEEEAIKFARVLDTRGKLRKLALELNEGREMNFGYGSGWKYYLWYSYMDNKIKQQSVEWGKEAGVIYCLDKKFIDKAIERIDRKRLTEYLTYQF